MSPESFLYQWTKSSALVFSAFLYYLYIAHIINFCTIYTALPSQSNTWLWNHLCKPETITPKTVTVTLGTERSLPDNLCAIPEHLHIHSIRPICMGHQVELWKFRLENNSMGLRGYITCYVFWFFLTIVKIVKKNKNKNKKINKNNGRDIRSQSFAKFSPEQQQLSP